MTTIGTLTLQEAAKELAGNWTNFNGFAWSRKNELEDPDNWAIIYTHNRDSGLLDQSNAWAIAKMLKPFTEGDDLDVVVESHAHWAVGHVDGFSVRVFNCGRITEAFRVYHELAERLADYPILDEEDYSMRELGATIDNLTEAGRRLGHEYALPIFWESLTYVWLSMHRPESIENRDDRGGNPSEDDLRAAFKGLEFLHVDD